MDAEQQVTARSDQVNNDIKMEKSESCGGQTALQVTMDGQPLQLPEWLSSSLSSIRTYLECVAMKSDRVLWTLRVDGVKLDLTDSSFPTDCFRVVRANTISYDELSQRLISAGQLKVHELLDLTANASLTLLINDDQYAHQLWADWEPQLREPLFSLRALDELRRTQGDEGLDDINLPNQLEHLTFLCSEVDSLLWKGEADGEVDLVAFSEIVDYTLVPWLRWLEQQFALLQAEQRGL